MEFQTHHEEKMGKLHNTFKLVLPSLQFHWRVQHINIIWEHLPPHIDPQTTNLWLTNLGTNLNRTSFHLHPKHKYNQILKRKPHHDEKKGHNDYNWNCNCNEIEREWGIDSAPIWSFACMHPQNCWAPTQSNIE